jgi:TATA-binding protein-associated factor Taf7
MSGGGVAAIITAFAKRRTIQVDAAARLNDAALKYVAEQQAAGVDARQEAREARQEASEARREATEAHRQMSNIRREAELLADDLRRLRMAIMDPHITLERLRAMVGDQSANGAERE